MKLLIIFSLLTSSLAQAFTLNTNFGGGFKASKISVRIAGDSTCQQGITIYELQDLLKEAVDKFWNTVPTSRLRMDVKNFAEITGTDFNRARLCSPTDAECINDAANTNGVIPPVKDIIVTCNRSSINYNSTSVVAVTVPNNISGKYFKGSVILINDTGDCAPGNICPPFKNLSQNDKIAVLAHEIGHAIGLGHAEKDDALMYYRTQGLRKNLSQDDIDGVTYLYPRKLDGCGLFGGIAGTLVVKGKDDDDQTGSGPGTFIPMIMTLLGVIIIGEILKLLKGAKARPAL